MSFLTSRIMIAAGALLLVAAAGCESGTIEANQQVLKEQQAQIERMQREIESLQQNQSAGYSPAPAAPNASGGGCDAGVEQRASRRGGDRFSAGDFVGALGYYRDALAACPGDARAELNVARAYEALGDKAKAVKHYRVAAQPVNGTISEVQNQASAALLRLQASMLP